MAEDPMAMYRQTLERLSTGGKTLEADLADIEAGKRTAVAGGQQALIGAGLGGTTVTGAVPLAAEKTAGRARLRARGGAESRYMIALMSFANLAEASRQQELNRRMSYKTSLMGAQTQLQMAGRPAGGTMQAPVRTYGGTFGASSFPDMFDPFGLKTPGAGGQAQQFPSLYGQAGQQAPSLMGGAGATADTPWPTPAQGFWGASEQWRGEQPGWVTGTGTVEGQAKQAVTAGLPPSAQGKPQVDTTGWSEAEKRAWANYVPGVSGYNVAAAKAQGRA